MYRIRYDFMNTHFCKIRSTRPKFNITSSLKELEQNYLQFIEEAYNVMQTDANLSDILYHEALKLKKTIFNLKHSDGVDAGF